MTQRISESTPEDFKTFVIEYPFNGTRWLFDIKAKDWADAEARLKALGWGKVLGQSALRAPGWLPQWCADLYCWWKNL